MERINLIRSQRSSVGGDKSSQEFNASHTLIYHSGGGSWYRGKEHPGLPLKRFWEIQVAFPTD